MNGESLLRTEADFAWNALRGRDPFVKGPPPPRPHPLKLLQKHLSEHDEEAELVKDAKGKLVANPDLRDYENVPLNQDINEYFKREVIPHVPQAWIDETKTDSKDGLVGIVGYEIPFNRHFYEYVPPRELAVIDEELETLTKEILEILHEV